ncbi:MAG: helix-turn-helix domain-containing protein [Myxococcota bacterium]|jgi:cytoskeletal protein RodZ
MGQGIGGVPEAPGVGGGASPGREPIGRYISQQRRLRGIELDEIALRTRIPRRSLERLEAGAFDHSPDGFSRGFVRTVAEAIGLDPDDAVARMLPEPDSARRELPSLGRQRALLAAALLLLVAAVAISRLDSEPAAAPEPRPDAAPRMRRDAVRALAEARGIDTAALTDEAAELPPLPPEEPAAEAVPEPEASEVAAAKPAPPPHAAAAPPAARTTSAEVAPAVVPAAAAPPRAASEVLSAPSSGADAEVPAVPPAEAPPQASPSEPTASVDAEAHD